MISSVPREARQACSGRRLGGGAARDLVPALAAPPRDKSRAHARSPGRRCRPASRSRPSPGCSRTVGVQVIANRRIAPMMMSATLASDGHQASTRVACHPGHDARPVGDLTRLRHPPSRGSSAHGTSAASPVTGECPFTIGVPPFSCRYPASKQALRSRPGRRLHPLVRSRGRNCTDTWIRGSACAASLGGRAARPPMEALAQSVAERAIEPGPRRGRCERGCWTEVDHRTPCWTGSISTCSWTGSIVDAILTEVDIEAVLDPGRTWTACSPRWT